MSEAEATARSASRARFDAMHETIRERICLLEYPPGTRLGEQALAAEFGVSRTPIRRVLARLETEGLVESRHGVGTVVTTIDQSELRQVYELRMRLAEMIGELGPLAVDAERIDSMRAIRDQCPALAAAPDARRFCRLNMAFHEQLSAAIANTALREVSRQLYYQTARIFLHRVSALELSSEIAVFAAEIDEIIAAMRRGDDRGVGLARRNHIAASLYRLTELAPAEGASDTDDPGAAA